MTKEFGGCQGFYDPVAEYMEGFCSGNGRLVLCSKEQVFYHKFSPFNPSFLIWIKHDEETKSYDHLLDWIHWKLEVTWLNIDA